MYLKLSSRRSSGIMAPAKSPVSRRSFYESTGNLSVSCFLCLISSNDYLKEPFEQVASSLTAGKRQFSPIDCQEFLGKNPSLTLQSRFDSNSWATLGCMEQRQSRSPVDTAMLARCDKCCISIQWKSHRLPLFNCLGQLSFLSRFVDEFTERALQLTRHGGAHI